ncbi:hypothetical protein EV421DRAFT_1742236 [Armillaria borealis]|uniref:Uncharacterized protein n=1 Tax=Armillaria borealis TaxID=47425 RepID=A0AA39MG53_9AGAR|nr:hypothetical protein EV421DRAFT_1742236 [Armillaria borealis]
MEILPGDIDGHNSEDGGNPSRLLIYPVSVTYIYRPSRRHLHWYRAAPTVRQAFKLQASRVKPKINIHIQTDDGIKITVLVRRDTKFSKVVQAAGWLGTFKFTYEGKRIQKDEGPAEVDREDDSGWKWSSVVMTPRRCIPSERAKGNELMIMRQADSSGALQRKSVNYIGKDDQVLNSCNAVARSVGPKQERTTRSRQRTHLLLIGDRSQEIHRLRRGCAYGCCPPWPENNSWGGWLYGDCIGNTLTKRRDH